MNRSRSEVRIGERGSRLAAGPGGEGRVLVLALLLLLISQAAGCRGVATDPAGLWQGQVRNPSGEEVAFTLEVAKAEGGGYRGTLINGEDRTASTSGSWDGRRLSLRFDYYDGELSATIEGARLEGEFTRQWQKQTLTRRLTAKRAATVAPAGAGPAGAPEGDWVLRVGVAPNQRLWRAAFHADGGRMIGTIIPVTGDWGRFTGTFDGQTLLLNRFDGINGRLLRLKKRPDGLMEGMVDLGLLDPVRPVLAERLDPNNQQLVASLPDPDTYTRVSNPAEPFRFAFPDTSGQMVTSDDPRFRDRVLAISITGSWCPNCHEESPVMQEYYDRYRERGFEVIALAFEYTGDPQRDIEQLKIFAARHHLTYPLLLAGTTEDGEVQRKLPQLVNFAAYPTTIFVGRDGRVRRIHTGFEGKATGERHTRLRAEYERLIEELLAE